jgi:hypothetical protein
MKVLLTAEQLLAQLNTFSDKGAWSYFQPLFAVS